MRPSRQLHTIVFLFDDVDVHEAVTVPGNRADKPRLARIVAERPANRTDGLAQRAVGNDDIAPDPVEDVAAMDRFMPPFDKKDQQIEIAWDEGLLEPLADQRPATRRQDEIAEAITRHNLTTQSPDMLSDDAWPRRWPKVAVGQPFSRVPLTPLGKLLITPF